MADSRISSLPPASSLSGTELVPVSQAGVTVKTPVDAIAARAAAATPDVVQFAASDEATALTTGSSKITLRMPFAITLDEVRASLSAASSSGPVTVDINKNGASILSTKLTIDQGEKTSTTAATEAVISDVDLGDDDEITIDIDGAGSGAKGLKIALIGPRA